MKKFLATVLLLASMLFVLAGCGDSSNDDLNSWEKIEDKGVFVLGFDEGFPPMGYKDDGGNYVGFDLDVATEVMDRLDVELKLQSIDWDSKDQELNTGNIDAIWNGFTINDDRKKQVLFTEPYMNNRQVLVVMGDTDYTELSDFEGKVLGLQAGSSANDALDNSPEFKDSLKNVVSLDTNVLAFMDLEKGGIDVLLVDEIVGRYYISHSDKDYRVLDKELAREEFGIGFRKDDQELMEKVETTLKEMAEDGTLAKISNDWFGEDITTIGK